jgi:hypothetical protein
MKVKVSFKDLDYNIYHTLQKNVTIAENENLLTTVIERLWRKNV